jgi:hypothetical protein
LPEQTPMATSPGIENESGQKSSRNGRNNIDPWSMIRVETRYTCKHIIRNPSPDIPHML